MTGSHLNDFFSKKERYYLIMTIFFVILELPAAKCMKYTPADTGLPPWPMVRRRAASVQVDEPDRHHKALFSSLHSTPAPTCHISPVVL